MKHFIHPDPLGIDGGVNVYAMANMNPLAFVDPYGLEAMTSGARAGEKLRGALNRSVEFTQNALKSIGHAAWRKTTAWNFEGRDGRNINLPEQGEIANQPGWRREYKDLFHQNGGARELKWVNDLDGREVVYDGDTGQILRDQYRGTYNYINVAPTPQRWYDVGGWLTVGATMIGHGAIDVAPWKILGIDR